MKDFIIKNLMGMNLNEKRLKYSEIGKLLNITPAKVKRISTNAIQKLRNTELGTFYNNKEL